MRLHFVNRRCNRTCSLNANFKLTASLTLAESPGQPSEERVEGLYPHVPAEGFPPVERMHALVMLVYKPLGLQNSEFGR